MSIVAEVHAELEKLRERAEEAAAKLKPEVDRLQALEGNPVVDALLAAVHVSPSGFALVVSLLEGLEKLYAPVQPAQVTTTGTAAQAGQVTVSVPPASQ